MSKWFLFFILFLSALLPRGVLADPLQKIHPVVQQILEAQEEPDGVVFDIETLQPDALPNLAPYIGSQIQLIKGKFPNVEIAVVSHGTEEFALQKQARSTHTGLHDMFNSLVANEGVSIHVCGAVGGLKNLTQEDFPEFVSYSASGMAQINDYKALGYTVVPIHQLTEKQRKDLFEHKERYIKP